MSLNNPSVVLFQECSYGQWFPLAETCEDSARSGPMGDLQFYRDRDKCQKWLSACFKRFSWKLVKSAVVDLLLRAPFPRTD